MRTAKLQRGQREVKKYQVGVEGAIMGEWSEDTNVRADDLGKGDKE